MSNLKFIIYHTALKIILFILKIFHSIHPPKLQNYISERKYPQLIWRQDPRPNQRRIWFHAASGEVEYIKPLLKLAKATNPDDLLFLTYFSTSALDLIPRIPELDGWAPLPFDLPIPCINFLKTLKPDLLIISRTDLWPTILKTFDSKPKILIASTWAEGSKKTHGLGRFMSQWCLPYLTKVCVVNNNDRNWINENIKGAPEIIVTGDPRFDQVKTRLNQNRPIPALLKLWLQEKSHRTFIAGSTWEEDEMVLFEALAIYKRNHSLMHGSDYTRWIFVPHENTTEHLKKIRFKLTSLGLSCVFWSEIKEKEISVSNSILIFDEKGWLAELYQLADFAFVGGSYKRQVHSVMEALGCGLPVLVGPNYKNNREAIDFSSLSLRDIPFVRTVEDDANSMAQCYHFYINLDSTLLIELKEKIHSAFNLRCGGTQKTFSEIQKYLNFSEKEHH